MAKPNFIIAGVARSGTTSLYYYLKQHPDIGFPDKKEPKYFSSKFLSFPHNGPGDKYVDSECIKNDKHYYSLYQSLIEKRIGDASSDYFYYGEQTSKAIFEELGDIPIIIMLRNPIERALSAYNNLVRDGREQLPFSEAISKEAERIEQNFDWMWAYSQGGFYCDKVRIFKQQFKNVKIIFYEEFVQNPLKKCEEIFDFLSVDKNFKPDTSSIYSHSGKIDNQFIKALSNRNNKLSVFLRRLILKLVPRKFVERILSKVVKKQSTDEETLGVLRKHHAKDIECLEQLLQEKISCWN